MSAMKNFARVLGGVGLVLASALASAAHITPDVTGVEVMHKGKKVVISRTESDTAVIPDAYLKTGRHCPPFCIQPMQAAPGVETIGELEVLHYLTAARGAEQGYVGNPAVLVVDSRTPEWIARGTIPGSVNIPWNKISVDIAGGFPTGAEQAPFHEILANEFGARKAGDGWDFAHAKTLVLFCNGIWCPQSATNIQTLLRLGYPAAKLKWYRGGMQDWVTAGLTTVTE